MSDPECPYPHLTGDAARWLLAVTGPLTVRLDNPHAAETTMMATAVRGELTAIAAAERVPDGDGGGLPPDEPADE